MKLSTVFRRAHDLVASGDARYRYSCDAILAVAKGRCPSALFFWRDHFTPSADSPESYWLTGTGMPDAEKHKWRLTALLLATEMTKGMK